MILHSIIEQGKRIHFHIYCESLAEHPSQQLPDPGLLAFTFNIHYVFFLEESFYGIQIAFPANLRVGVSKKPVSPWQAIQCILEQNSLPSFTIKLKSYLNRQSIEILAEGSLCQNLPEIMPMPEITLQPCPAQTITKRHLFITITFLQLTPQCLQGIIWKSIVESKICGFSIPYIKWRIICI